MENYLALAERSTQLAEGSELPQVRQKHELAASVWLQLANVESLPLAQRVAMAKSGDW